MEGTLPAALACREGGETLVLPEANLAEAMRCRGGLARGVPTLAEACAALAAGAESLGAVEGGSSEAAGTVEGEAARRRGAGGVPDLAEVVGQHGARRALEIAAAGEHNLLLCGPPGTGKSMLASRLPGVLPPLTESEAGEVAAIASVSRAGFDPTTWGRRPFRSPHHTVSGVALVGGGVPPQPGEVSLAHRGVLFLDELTEFRRAVLEVLREPLESGRVSLSRATHQAEFPARFQLVAAMNPCPCGHHGTDTCRCTPDTVLRYRERLSGPFLDRIDLHVEVQREPLAPAMLAFLGSEEGSEAGEGSPGEGSDVVRERTRAARCRQLARQGCVNGRLSAAELGRCGRLEGAGQRLLADASVRLGLSLRGVHRVLRVARTIADLAAEESIGKTHLAEALGYRERVAPQLSTPTVKLATLPADIRVLG